MMREDYRRVQQEAQVEYVDKKLRGDIAAAQAEGQSSAAAAAAGTVDSKLDEAMNKSIPSSSSDDKPDYTKVKAEGLTARQVEKLSEAELEAQLKLYGHKHTSYQPQQRKTRGGIEKEYPYKRETMIDILFPLMGIDMSERSTKPTRSRSVAAPKPKTKRAVQGSRDKSARK